VRLGTLFPSPPSVVGNGARTVVSSNALTLTMSGAGFDVIEPRSNIMLFFPGVSGGSPTAQVDSQGRVVGVVTEATRFKITVFFTQLAPGDAGALFAGATFEHALFYPSSYPKSWNNSVSMAFAATILVRIRKVCLQDKAPS